MKHILMLAVALASAAIAHAADEWKLYFQNESIEIYYIYSDCHDAANGLHQQKVFYKFVNKTDYKVEVSFNKQMLYSNAKAAAADVENHIVLDKKSKAEGDCSTRNRALYTFIKQLDMKGIEVQKCELANIVVKRVQ